MNGIVSLRGTTLLASDGFPQYSKPVDCGFSSSRENYSDFAQFYKVLPLILPSSGKILCFGPGNGILCDVHFLIANFGSPTASGNPIIFSYREGHYTTHFSNPGGGVSGNLSVDVSLTEFAPNFVGQYLESETKNIKLYPIPFTAARGISWKGQSFSTNVASDEDLNAKLKNLAHELEQPKVTQWSYSTDTLPDGWSGDKFYSRVGIRRQYYGIIQEPEGSFGFDRPLSDE